MNTNNIYESVKKLVLECGDTLKNVDYDKEATLKNDGSLVTKYDLIMDKKLKEGLNSILDCPILSEEHKEDIGNTYFVVDPIDGTENFNIDFDLFCTMVAFVENKEIKFSFIYVPKLDKLYSAIKGKGAYLNDKKISVKKDEAKITGTCNLHEKSMEIMKSLKSKNKVSFRSIGSAGVALAYVASGVFDFYFSTSIGGPWDAIAGKLLIEEAGGTVKYNKSSNGFYEIMAGTENAIQLIESVGFQIDDIKEVF